MTIPFIGTLVGLQDDDFRYPYPQLNGFRSFVTRELIRRKTTYPTPINAPFIRLTSCQLDPTNRYIFFTLGLHGFEKQDLNIFDVTYGGGRDIVGYAYDLNNPKNGKYPKLLISADQLSPGTIPPVVNQTVSKEINDKIVQQRDRTIADQKKVFIEGAHPIPGIVDASIGRTGLGGAVKATVSWLCYNRAQLEFLRNHFLIGGNYVCLEWGQQHTDSQITKILDFGDVDTTKSHLVDAVVGGRKNVIKNWVSPNNGNYDFMVGMVGNFDINLDARTNVYTCTTTIYSVGEQVWGLNSHQTFVRTNVPTNSPAIQDSTTFADFFKIGGKFDKLVESDASSDQVALNAANWSRNNSNVNVKATDYKNLSTNAEDYRFITWTYFATKVLTQMFALIDNPNIKDDLNRFITLSGDTDWIGDNEFLQSTNPDVMLLIKKRMTNLPKQFAGAGYFDSLDSGGYRGKLTNGVWLNTGAIRKAFVETNDFQSAIKYLLTSMNNSVGNFWDLMLFYDDDSARYKVIDNKFTDSSRLPAFYKFNSGATIPEGELIDVNLSSAFPPELVTQMMIFAKFRTETSPSHEELMKEYPTIGTTSAFIFPLNWTSLVDVIEQDVRRRRASGSVALNSINDKLASYGVGSQPDKMDGQRTIAHVAGFDPGSLVSTTMTSKNSPAPAEKISLPSSLTKPPTLPTSATSPANKVTRGVKAVKSKYSDKILEKSKPYDTIIEDAASKYGVDSDLIRAIIAHESGFSPTATSSVGARGLMQLMPSTAGPSYEKNPEKLYDPTTNILLGTAHLKGLLNSRDTIESAISSYNGGAGKKFSEDGRFCLARNQKTRECLEWRNVKKGEFGNQPYVNSVMGYYNFFRSKKDLTPVVTATSNVVVPPPTPAAITKESNPVTSATAQQQAQQQVEADTSSQQAKEDYKNRFGDEILALVEPQPSAMVNKITRHGYEKYPIPNGFVAPFPTTTKVEVVIRGIGGISITDGFFVEKLPYIFERFGCFQITQVNEEITVRGWNTRIIGYFKLLWMDGEGPNPQPIISNQEKR